MTAVEITDYRPDNDLDNELADVFRAALAGWPDGQPITAEVVRGWLRPHSLTATTLALHRDPSGRLLAAAGLRWPGGPESAGRLLGPLVHPDGRGSGLASALLNAIDQVIDSRPGVRVSTVAILDSRSEGWALFERQGWHAAGNARLLTMALPGSFEHPDTGAPNPVSVRTIKPQEYIDPQLAALMASARPQISYASARDTFTRWTTDERYTPDGLLLAEAPEPSSEDAGGTGRLIGAALVYPMRRPEGDEQPEATLVDFVVAGGLNRTEAGAVRAALVEAVVATGIKLGATIARAFIDDEEMALALIDGGFEVADRIRYYGRQSGPSTPVR
jgi:GNAT superfamily N-acetyltransferase